MSYWSMVQIPAAPFLIPLSFAGKRVEAGPSARAPATSMGDPDTAPGSWPLVVVVTRE